MQSLFSAQTWRGLVCLTALHDAGKISPGFLRKCEAWLREANPDPQTARDWSSREKNHARVSHIFLGKLYGKPLYAGYAVAAGGHHGRFTCGMNCLPGAAESGAASREFNDAAFEAVRQELRARLEAEAVFGPLPQAPLTARGSDATLVVFLTGLITLADWIGSDETFFPLQDPTPDGETATLTRATDQATRALAGLHWGETAPVPEQTFKTLFRAADGTSFTPNSLQTALAQMAAAGPGLYVVEAPMGGGKTEAALHAAYLRWTVGGERGLYFALPTQLTSDRIYERANAFLTRAVAGPGVSTLVHGSAWLREERAIELRPAVPEAGANGDTAHAVDARRWFASGRRSLLAPFGAGTLDQALLSVLPAKHCGLRLFALAGKVVVCDEVHSYDPYTSHLLDALIADLLRLRCTVVVLTATLPAERKAQLLRAAGAKVVPGDTAYPLLTAVRTGSDAAETRAVTPDPMDARTVRLEHFTGDDPGVWERACEAAESGACVLVIRNTVASAQAAFRAVVAARCGYKTKVALLHSRFPRWRRDELEDVWLRRLGKSARQTEELSRPKGCVLVATQVVEQSVDIDADLLITDLAPTDPLLQRLGRMFRHSDNRRPEGFTQPQAWVLHPPLDETLDAKEIKKALGASGKVYPPSTLFRTWQLWHGKTEVRLPEEIRPLLDATYAPLPDEASAGLRALSEELQTQVTRRIDTAAARLDRLGGLSKDDQDDGTLTRWREQEMMDLLLLSEPPTRGADGQWNVAPLDGAAVLRINPYQWRLSVAQALHRNVVRVPLYAVREWLAGTPPYLKDYFEGGVVVGVVASEEVQPLTEMETGCRVGWNKDEGISVQIIKTDHQMVQEHLYVEDEEG